MELINVFLVFGGCQGALVTHPLPLSPLFQVSTILHVSCILGPFYNNKKFMWPSTTNNNNKLVAYYCHHFFFQRRRKRIKEAKKKPKKKGKKKNKDEEEEVFFSVFCVLWIFLFPYCERLNF
jgi:hypothetical protein